MASINLISPGSETDQEAWNEAYERVRNFLETFALGDHTQAPRLALKLGRPGEGNSPHGSFAASHRPRHGAGASAYGRVACLQP